MLVVGVLIIILFVAALCIFVKWAGKKEGYEFNMGRVFLMLLGSSFCGGPFALLAWYLWPLEKWLAKLVSLLSFFAFLFGPWLPIRLLGWNLPFSKIRK